MSKRCQINAGDEVYFEAGYKVEEGVVVSVRRSFWGDRYVVQEKNLPAFRIARKRDQIWLPGEDY